MSELVLRGTLAWLAPLGFELALVLAAGSALVARRAIARSFEGTLALAVGLAALALTLALLLPPRTHRIYYDEDIYQNVAQNLLGSGQAEMCNEGTVAEGALSCRAGEYNKEPVAFAFVLSLLFRLTGVHEDVAHWVNPFLFAIGVIAAVWVAAQLTADIQVAAAAGVVYLLTPQNLLWSATISAEPGAAATAGIAVGGALLYFRERSWSAGLLMASTMATAAQWRPESLLVVPVVGAVALLRGRLNDRRLAAAALLGVLLLIPALLHFRAVMNEDWGSPQGGKFSRQYLPGNLRTNALFFVDGRDYPRLFTALALLGLAWRGSARTRLVLGLWLVSFWGVFIPFYAGSYRYGVDVRFSLLCAMPLAVLAGRGFGQLMARMAPASGSAQVIGFLALLYSFSSYLPLVRAVGVEGRAARADHAAAREFVALVPPQSIVLSHNPGMLQVMGQSAAQTSLGTHRRERLEWFFAEFPGGVYFHYNFWCNVPDPVQSGLCRTILSQNLHQVVAERSAGWDRFVLYRLLPRTE
jgi:hypothetical protein